MSDMPTNQPPADAPQEWPATPAMKQAIACLQQGKGAEAEAIVTKALADAEASFGKDTPQYATAQNELGTVLLGVGQPERAIAAFHAALAGPLPAEPQAQRDRVTYIMNLGQALAHANRLDEAENVLRQGLAARQQLYGREHTGFAFGLEPLAELLLIRGKAGEALEMLQEAVANYWRNGHGRVVGALALRAEALKAAGKESKEVQPFADLEKLPDVLIEHLSQAVIQRTGLIDPIISRKVLADLVPLTMKRLGESHALTLSALSTAANLERTLGPKADHRLRQGAIQLAVGAFDRSNRPAEALQAVMGLALAYSDAGRNERAVATYNDAVARADKLPDPTLRVLLKSQVLRNFGLLLAELKRPEEAEAKLREAVALSQPAGDPAANPTADAAAREMFGRAQTALGIFLQHAGRADEAKAVLEASATVLDSTHPDAISGRTHLDAIATGGKCGCGDTGAAMAEAFKQYVASRLPPDLLDRLEVRLKDKSIDPAAALSAAPGAVATSAPQAVAAATEPSASGGGVAKDFEVGLHLKREPTEEEVKMLNRVMNDAVNEFRQRVAAAR